jgi:hypothetical protein
MPLVSRDEIKEGYVNTYGVPHSDLPPDANARATDLFFEIVEHHLAGGISVVIEAAFQNSVWKPRIEKIATMAAAVMVICSIDDDVAVRRYLERGLADASREFYHGDNMVVHYRRTGEILPPATYTAPDLDMPTIRVSTDGDYVPGINEIVAQIRSLDVS